jgi:hypothetical protein
MALAGLYAYSLQGWMQAKNISTDTDGKGTSGTSVGPSGIHPGWGDPNPEKWWSRKWRYPGMPMGDPARLELKQRYSLNAVTAYITGGSSAVNLRAAPADDATGIRTVAGPAFGAPVTIPEPEPPFVVEAGYYPFSELGVWYFENGDVSGWASVNTAGHTGDSGVPYTQVFGKFLHHADNVIPRPTGAISMWFPDVSKGNHFWDYFFVLSSDLEGQLIVADRLPRPATGLGTLRQISINRPAYIGWPIKEGPDFPNY